MPLRTREIRTRSGHRVLESTYEGDVTVADAQAFMALVAPGAEHEHSGHLALGRVTALSGEVRKVLGAQKPNPLNPPPVALVIESAMMRMVASLVSRGTENANTEFFKNADEAMAWLDGRMAVYEQKRAAKK